MHPFFDRILTINLICSTVVFYAGARIYILPKIKESNPQVVLIPILILHSLRHLGWNDRFDHRDHAGHGLRSADLHGCGILDTGVLGSRTPCHPLSGFHRFDQAIRPYDSRATVSFGGRAIKGKTL
jgi:hypothetical protein